MSNTLGLEITEIRIVPNKDPDAKFLAVVNIVFNACFAVHGIRIVHGKILDSLFVTWPRLYNSKTKKGYSTAFPITQLTAHQMTEQILQEYKKFIEGK